MMTQLILLSAHPDAPSTCLQVDPAGRILARQRLELATPLAPAPPSVRTVLAVPGADTRALWLELPARNPVQALAAATILIEDHVAGAREALHIAVESAPAAGRPDASRLVVLLERGVLQGWLDRAAVLGVDADVVIPEYLLMAPPDQGVRIAAIDDRWVVRGDRLAFSSEPALAKLVIGDADNEVLQDRTLLEQHFAATAVSPPPINLLQYSFASQATRREGWQAYRRAALLFVLLALSPLLVAGTQALRYELAARSLQSQSRTLARTVVPDLGENDDAREATRARLLDLQAADAFARSAGALFDAVRRIGNAQLDKMSYNADGGLQATVFHTAATDIDSIRIAAEAAGLTLQLVGTESVDGGIRSDLLLEPRR